MRRLLGAAASCLAIILVGCGGTSAEDAYDHADTAIGAIDTLRQDLEEATSRIDDLEQKVSDLEDENRNLGYRVDDLESR